MYKLDRLNNLSRNLFEISARQAIEEELECNCKEQKNIHRLFRLPFVRWWRRLLAVFRGTLRDGFAAAFVGVLLKLDLVPACSSMKMKQIFSNIILRSILDRGFYVSFKLPFAGLYGIWIRL